MATEPVAFSNYQERLDKAYEACAHRTMLDRLMGVMAGTLDVAGTERAHDRKRQRDQMLDSRKDRSNAVVKARFSLGADDGAYLRSSVMPLQTAIDDGDEDTVRLGRKLTDEMKMASYRGVLVAYREWCEAQSSARKDQLKAVWEIAAWALSIKEVRDYVYLRVQTHEDGGDGGASPAPVADISGHAVSTLSAPDASPAEHAKREWECASKRAASIVSDVHSYNFTPKLNNGYDAVALGLIIKAIGALVSADVKENVDRQILEAQTAAEQVASQVGKILSVLGSETEAGKSAWARELQGREKYYTKRLLSERSGTSVHWSVAFCAARGLCARRAVHHQPEPEDASLLYTTPTRKMPSLDVVGSATCGRAKPDHMGPLDPVYDHTEVKVVPDFCEFESQNSTSAALWAPVASSETTGGVQQLDASAGTQAVSEAAVLEHLVDFYKAKASEKQKSEEGAMRSEGGNADANDFNKHRRERLGYMACASLVKLRQLRYTATVFDQATNGFEKLCPASEYQTNPVVEGDGGRVVYPADAGLVSLPVDEETEKVETKERKSAVQRIKKFKTDFKEREAAERERSEENETRVAAAEEKVRNAANSARYRTKESRRALTSATEALKRMEKEVMELKEKTKASNQNADQAQQRAQEADDSVKKYTQMYYAEVERAQKVDEQKSEQEEMDSDAVDVNEDAEQAAGQLDDAKKYQLNAYIEWTESKLEAMRLEEKVLVVEAIYEEAQNATDKANQLFADTIEKNTAVDVSEKEFRDASETRNYRRAEEAAESVERAAEVVKEAAEAVKVEAKRVEDAESKLKSKNTLALDESDQRGQVLTELRRTIKRVVDFGTLIVHLRNLESSNELYDVQTTGGQLNDDQLEELQRLFNAYKEEGQDPIQVNKKSWFKGTWVTKLDEVRKDIVQRIDKILRSLELEQPGKFDDLEFADRILGAVKEVGPNPEFIDKYKIIQTAFPARHSCFLRSVLLSHSPKAHTKAFSFGASASTLKTYETLDALTDSMHDYLRGQNVYADANPLKITPRVAPKAKLAAGVLYRTVPFNALFTREQAERMYNEHLENAMLSGVDCLQEIKRLVVEKEETNKTLQNLTSSQIRNVDSEADRAQRMARAQREEIWNDAMREAAISGDRLYAFARQFSGTINDGVDAVCLIDESALVRQQKDRDDEARKMSSMASQTYMQLVSNVFKGVLAESGLVLGIAPADGRVAGSGLDGDLKVVSNSLRKQVSQLASGGGGDGFFTNSVRLENLLAQGSGELTLAGLFSKLKQVGDALQSAALNKERDTESASTPSLEFLSSPRNSLLLRWKPEASAAIRAAFETFQREMRFELQRSGHLGEFRKVSAFELMEGNSDELTMAFATYCAHTLAHQRMFSASQAGYLGTWSSAANAAALRFHCGKLVNAALRYVERTPRPYFLQEHGWSYYFGVHDE